MYVRVLHQNKEYYSYVFMYFSYDYMPQYVVYDSENKKFEVVAYLSKKCDGHRQIGFLNEHEDGFIRKSEMDITMGKVYKCCGYDWLINDTSMINDICEGKEIDEKYHKIAKEMNDTIDPDKWNEVITEDDAEDMMNHVGGFHDWYLVEVKGYFDDIDFMGESSLVLRFRSQAAFDVLVEFSRDVYLNYGFTSCNRIYLSSVVVDGEAKYWVDGEEDVRKEFIKEFSYIKSESLRWKFIIKTDEEW